MTSGELAIDLIQIAFCIGISFFISNTIYERLEK